ncbi:MAG TPA: ornithine carbamoyltransferase [Candidatus Saccharimonadales bacterium]|jgi:ornithine carbamoyltransferase|nr:ornithine carbamoyltransferase [Candidatus Saccharimonadales bacterium]
MMGTRVYDYAALSAPVEQPVNSRDLVSVQDFSPEEIRSLFELTNIIKHRPADFRAALAGKQIVLFFEKASLRTRVTFEAGMASLGGNSMFVDQTRSRLHEREPLHDIAHNVERWVDAVVLRTFEHQTIVEMAKYARIPVINALSDLEHPCQALADLFTLQEKFGDLSRVHLAYVGDGNNMAHSLMLAAASMGGKISIATPAGYAPNPEITAATLEIAARTGAQLIVTEDPCEAVHGADAVYTDVWASMGQEEETAFRSRIFATYQVNDALIARAAEHAVFMHCLPAHREHEVSSSVIDSPRSVVFDQSENRMHVQKAILLLLLGGGIRRFPSRSNHA